MNTLMGIVDIVTKRERKRYARLLIFASLVVIVGSVIAAALLIPDRGEFDWEGVYSRVKPSVCLAMFRAPGDIGRETACGTVWSIGDGVFATNAHVAELFGQELKALGGQIPEIIIRTPGPDPQDMRVVDVKLHPGYIKWKELVKKYNPYDPGEKKFFATNSFHACDVALMYIDKADRWKQPKPLRLASRSELAAVKPGYQLATAGYPSEGIILNTKQPIPEGRFGTIIKVGDEFLRPTSSKNAMFVWCDWSSAGGASGSPIFNPSGEVIALLSAGNVVGKLGGTRIAVGGSTIGTHVNVLKELLDSTADDRQAKRNAVWVEEMKRLYTFGTEAMDSFCEQTALVIVADWTGVDPKDLVAKRTHKSSINLIISDGKPARYEMPGLTLYDGVNVMFAIAKNRPTAIWAYFEHEDIVRPEEISRYWDYDAVPAQGTVQAKVVIESGANEQDGTTEVVVYLYRVVPKPK